MKRDARGRAGRIALNAEAKKGRTCYTKSIFSCLLFRAAGKNQPKGPNAISPQNLAFTGVNSPTRFEAPSPASKQAAFGSFGSVKVLKSKKPPARAQRAREPKKGALVRTTRRPSARRSSQGSAAEARGAKRKRGIFKAPGGRVWPIPRDCFPRFRHGARHRAVPRRPEAPSENEVFSRRLAGERGLYLAIVSHDFGTGRHRAVPRRPEAPSENEVFSRRLAGERGLHLAIVSHDLGRALTEGSAGDGSAEAPGREESFERPRVVAYAPRGAGFPFGFGSPPFAPGAMKRDARGRAGRIALNAEARKRSHVLYKIHVFMFAFSGGWQKSA